MDKRLDEYSKHGFKSYIYNDGEGYKGVVLYKTTSTSFFNSDKETVIEEMVAYMDDEFFGVEKINVAGTVVMVLLLISILAIFASFAHGIVLFFEWLFK